MYQTKIMRIKLFEGTVAIIARCILYFIYDQISKPER